MKIFLVARGIVVATFAIAACFSWAQNSCNYSPAFQKVRSSLETLPTIDAVKALHALAVKNQSPEFCESIAIDEALDAREKLLVTLVGKASGEYPAHKVFRCNLFNAKTAQCQSPMEDGTAQRNSSGAMTSLPIEKSGAFEVKSKLPNAKLHAVYVTTISGALDGKPAKRLRARGTIKGTSLAPNTVLIAIYKTKDAWAYRKVVWYF